MIMMMMMMTMDKQRSACRSAGMKVVSGPEILLQLTDNPVYKRFDRQRHTLHSPDNFPAERLKGKSFSQRNRQQQIRQRLRPRTHEARQRKSWNKSGCQKPKKQRQAAKQIQCNNSNCRRRNTESGFRKSERPPKRTYTPPGRLCESLSICLCVPALLKL